MTTQINKSLIEAAKDVAPIVAKYCDEAERERRLEPAALHGPRREPEAAEEARELAHYEPETAGGLMTTEFASLPPDTKVWEAMDAARRLGREELAEMLYYIYVCEPTGKLVGVVSLCASMYVNHWYWPTICFITGVVCLVGGLVVLLKRRDSRVTQRRGG